MIAALLGFACSAFLGLCGGLGYGEVSNVMFVVFGDLVFVFGGCLGGDHLRSQFSGDGPGDRGVGQEDADHL